MDPQSVSTTAGLGGFLAFFLLAVALYFLMRNMNARMRRMAYRAEQEALEAEGLNRAEGVQSGDSAHPKPPDDPDSPAVDDDSSPSRS